MLPYDSSADGQPVNEGLPHNGTSAYDQPIDERVAHNGTSADGQPLAFVLFFVRPGRYSISLQIFACSIFFDFHFACSMFVACLNFSSIVNCCMFISL